MRDGRETLSTNLAFRLQILDKGIGYPRYPLDKIVPNRLFRWGLKNLLNPILQFGQGDEAHCKSERAHLFDILEIFCDSGQRRPYAFYT